MTLTDVIATCLKVHRMCLNDERTGAVMHELGEEFSLQQYLPNVLEYGGITGAKVEEVLTAEAQAAVNAHLANPKESNRFEALPNVRAWKLIAYAGTFATALPLTKDNVDEAVTFLTGELSDDA